MEHRNETQRYLDEHYSTEGLYQVLRDFADYPVGSVGNTIYHDIIHVLDLRDAWIGLPWAKKGKEGENEN